MNVLKIMLIVIAALILIVLIISLFVKNDYKIEREIVINKPRSTVFDYIRYLKNQDNYNVWVMTDPNMKKSYRGTDGTIGFVYAWDGNQQAGKGEEEITKLTDNEVHIELRFEKPFKNVGQALMSTREVSDNQTSVKWSMRGTSTYPMNLMNLAMNGILGKDLEKSLDNLKEVLEKQQQPAGL
jgi:uncharacterized protein YndB with AHSA1/START domain